MTYEQWTLMVPAPIRDDPVWKLEAYRLGLFLSELAWTDSTSLSKDRRTISVADQLFRAASNISSNVCEGYSRSTGKDRARFFEYALGSARETRDWYFKGRRVLSKAVVEHRLQITSSVIALLVTTIRNERKRLRIVERTPA